MKILVVMACGCCLVLGLSCGLRSSTAGQPVMISEVENLMGSQCYENGKTKMQYCYGTNCSKNGCGCTCCLPTLATGTATLKCAENCGTSSQCTQQFNLCNKKCTGSP